MSYGVTKYRAQNRKYMGAQKEMWWVSKRCIGSNGDMVAQ